jgi:hypothetical protein
METNWFAIILVIILAGIGLRVVPAIETFNELFLRKRHRDKRGV